MVMAGEPVQRRLQFVLEHYGKRPTENVLLNYFGLANEVYTITTDEGRFVVKNCFKNNTPELVANEAALIQHLNNQDVPCPKLVPTKAGEPFLKYDNQFYIMNEFMPGYTPTWEEHLSESVVAESVHAMADFHRATEHFEPPHKIDLIQSLDVSGIKNWLEALNVELAEADQNRQSVEKMQQLIEPLLQLNRELEQDIDNSDLSDLKQVYIHGDLHCFNMIFSEDESRYNGVVDFDFSRKDYRLVDFFWASRSILWSYWYPTLFGEKPTKKSEQLPAENLTLAMQETIGFMIGQYRNYYELPDNEIKLLPLFAKALPLYTVRFFKLTNSEDECLSHVNWFRFQLDSLEQTVSDIDTALDSFFQKQAKNADV
jgi:Ser/Thr protein kinase RdoA (MazF antagonist)